jgi:hypothetical protein
MRSMGVPFGLEEGKPPSAGWGDVVVGVSSFRSAIIVDGGDDVMS